MTASPADPLPPDHTDWIVARATAQGIGAIAIVRLDGPGCWQAAAAVWAPPGGASPDTPPLARALTLGSLVTASGDRLDEALLAWFPAPHSYTGNDLVEFHCHASPAVVAALIDSLAKTGARLARPGEFTERAFLNGRLDLAQAEGVANLIAARTETASRLALGQLEGTLSRQVLAARDALIDLGAEIEAHLDFPEEEIEARDQSRMRDALDGTLASLERLLATARRGRLFRDGARVVIAGKPNTGKSSLFNALVGLERALVTPHPGTTRDTIEATLDIQGMPIVLVDTAGVRHEGAEEIESLGIARALREIDTSDLVLFVVDGNQGVDTDDRRIYRAAAEHPTLLAINKTDLPAATEPGAIAAALGADAPEPILLCALRQETLPPLEEAIAHALMGAGEATADPETATVINQRHEERLRAAIEALTRTRTALHANQPGELVMVDLNETLAALGEIVGLAIDDAILSRIFSRFCIGK